MKVAGLGTLQGQLLCILSEKPAGATVSEILVSYADVANPPKYMTVQIRLTSLVSRGLVSRRITPDRPRSHTYELAEPYAEILKACAKDLVDNLFGSDVNRLRKTLDTLDT